MHRKVPRLCRCHGDREVQGRTQAGRAAQHQSSLSELERLVPQATVTVTVTVIPRQSAPGGNVTRTSRHVWFRDDSHGNHSEFTEILMNIQQRRLGRRNGSLAGCRVPVSGPGGGRAQVQDSLH